MSDRLRVLVIEDREDDAVLVERTLDGAGLDAEYAWVRELDEIRDALTHESWDAVLCDFRLGGYDAGDVLEVVREVDPELPFLVISGVITDVEAAGIMRAGANDFFQKDRFGHLAESIRREVRDAASRRALRSEQARFAAMIEHSAEWIALLDRGGIITYITPSVRALGYGVDELVGRALVDIVVDEDVQWARNKLGTVVDDSAEPERVELRLRHGGDGHAVDAELLIQNLLEHEHISALVVNARDVSVRKQVERRLREGEAFVRAVLDSLAHATAVLDGDGTIVSVNRTWDELVGTLGQARPRARIGVDLIEALRAASGSLDPDASAAVASGIEAVLRRRQALAEVALPMMGPPPDAAWSHDPDAPSTSDEGPTRWYTARATPLPEPHEGAVVTLTDVSAQHRVEEEQRRLLERHRELDGMKNAFLAAVSHELRTPLTSVRGVADSLVTHADRMTDEQLRAFYESLRRQSVRLERLLADLLDVNRLTQGELRANRQVVTISTLVDRVLAAGSVPPDRVVDSGEDCTVLLDGPMVERIIENLLVNALKFSPPDAPVTLHYGPSDGGVLIRVDDAGPGVAPEDRRRIFEPFQRSDARATPGTGIGLTLVSRFARLHGGRAWVQDAEGGGASFRVVLPGPSAEEAAADGTTAG